MATRNRGRATFPPRPSRAKPDRRYRPGLESFEARLLMSNTYIVDSLGDAGDPDQGSTTSGDLRWAIGQANADPGSLIDVVATGTDTAASSLPDLAADVTIVDAAGPGSFILQGGGSSSNYNALTVDSGVTATISGLEFEDFDTSTGYGGDIRVNGTLMLEDSLLTQSSGFIGGAVFVEGGASLTTSQSTFSSDSSPDEGGAIQNAGTLDLLGGTVIEGNMSYAGAGILNANTMTANGVVIIGNTATLQGGGIYSG